MNKYLILVCMFSCNVIAQSNDENNCTKRLNGYVKGLETSIAANANTQMAEAQLNEIAKLRESLNDCDVISKIPAFVDSDNALKEANEALLNNKK